jgi:hypothetical protein
MDVYYVISKKNNMILLSCFNKNDLIDKLDNNYWGDNVVFLDKIPTNNNINTWLENVVLIIKGKIVEPEPIETIVSYGIK